MHRRFSRRHSKTNSTSATQGVQVDGDIAQCSRRQSWSGVFTHWRDKSLRTRKVLPNVTSPTSPQTSLTSMATTLPTSNNSTLSITPVPPLEHDTYHQHQHDPDTQHHHAKVSHANVCRTKESIVTYHANQAADRSDHQFAWHILPAEFGFPLWSSIESETSTHQAECWLQE